MYSVMSTYFSEGFQSFIKSHIAEERPHFMKNHKGSYFGRRFYDDEQVYQAFIMHMQHPNLLEYKNEDAFRDWAEKMEKGFVEMSAHDWRGFRNKLVRALREASDCDYYYDREKEW